MTTSFLVFAHRASSDTAIFFPQYLSLFVFSFFSHDAAEKLKPKEPRWVCLFCSGFLLLLFFCFFLSQLPGIFSSNAQEG